MVDHKTPRSPSNYILQQPLDLCAVASVAIGFVNAPACAVPLPSSATSSLPSPSLPSSLNTLLTVLSDARAAGRVAGRRGGRACSRAQLLHAADTGVGRGGARLAYAVNPLVHLSPLRMFRHCSRCGSRAGRAMLGGIAGQGGAVRRAQDAARCPRGANGGGHHERARR